MIRDRSILVSYIVALALLILAQIVGNGILNHWKAEGSRYSHSMFEKLGGKR